MKKKWWYQGYDNDNNDNYNYNDNENDNNSDYDDDDKTTKDYCSMIRWSEDKIKAEKTWGCLLSLRLRLFLRCKFVLSTPPFLFASCFLLLFKHGKRWLK